VLQLSPRRREPDLIDPVSDATPVVPATRRWLVAAFLLALAAFVPDAFGLQIFDTKIDLTVDPFSFLHNLIYLWNPNGWFGSLRDQYQGYVFPTAPFFILGHLLAIPAWLVQRAWMAALVTVAFWGAVRLAEALDIGSTPTRLASAAAFALWPTFTILVGNNSAAVAPGVLLPWVMIPLVRGSRGGATVRAAAFSGIAVLLMGGVNAAETLYSLVLPALYLLTRAPSPRRRSLMGWWVVCVGCATAWWAIPLLFLGKYGFNFLPYVEQSISTSSTSSAATSLRGLGDWTAYLNIGNIAESPAAWSTVYLPVVLVGSAVGAAAGLYGVTRRDMRERRFLVLSLALFTTAAMAAYWGPLGGPFSPTLRTLLDGTLAPFRNVYKLEPSIALILVLGIAHGLHRIRRPQRVSQATWRVLAAAGIVAVLASLATPYLIGRGISGQSYSSIPSYWYKVADYLDQHSPTTTALVLPAASHGEYVWGWTEDEPLEALARSPWADDENAPFSSAGATRMVDGIETVLKTGVPTQGLNDLITRAGIKYIVVQNDVEWQLSDSPSPLQVHQVLLYSGFRRVAKFGPKIRTATSNYPTLALDNSGLHVSYPAVEIFEARNADASHLAPITTYPTSTAALVSGGSEGILQLLGNNVLKTNQAAVLQGNWHGPYFGPLFAVTDTLRRANENFGQVNDNISYTYTASEKTPALARNPSDPSAPGQILPFGGTQNQTVAVLEGAKSVTASSYGSFWFSLPEYNPANVFDGNSNGWISGSPYGSDGEWVQIAFDHPVDPRGARIEPDTSSGHPRVEEVRVTTNTGSAVTRLRAGSEDQLLRVPSGKARFLRVTFVAVKAADGSSSGAGIKAISIPGVHVTSYLKPPQTPAGAGAKELTFSFATTQVSPTDILRAPPEPVMARVFSAPKNMYGIVTGYAQPRPSPALDALLAKSSKMTISASSSLGNLPQFRPQNLFDASDNSSWVAGGPHPTVTMKWPKPRVLKGLTVVQATGLDAAQPEEIRISSPFGSRLLHVGRGPASTLSFAPLDTDQITITFPKIQDRKSRDLLGQLVRDPVGLSELDFPALATYVFSPPTSKGSFSEPCGSGPSINIDGKVYKTSLKGNYGQLLNPEPIKVTACTYYGTVALQAGTNHLVAPITTSPFDITSLTIEQVPTPPISLASRAAHVVSWSSQSRQVAIAAGPATYLEVHQNYNAGWVATLDGKTLKPIQLDGWQQGYVVPSGKGGTVELKFTPEGLYIYGLIVGAIGVLILLLLALGLVLRDRSKALDPIPPWSSRLSPWLLLVLSAGVIFVVGGPLVLAVPILALVAIRRASWLPWLAAFAMTAAGVISAITPGDGAASHSGDFSAAAQACALVALTAVLVPVFGRRFRKPKDEWTEGPSDDNSEAVAEPVDERPIDPAVPIPVS
jgi:arabinofuranan 3-O-arabinosyltransferase